MKKRNWIKLIVTVIVLVIIALLIYMRRRPSGSWGTGKPDFSERSYYSNRIRNVIEKWLQSRSDTENYDRDDGRMKDSYTMFLVVDTAENGIWIEENGEVREDYYSEFPANMKWTFHRSTTQGVTELQGRTRLRIRGYYSEHQWPEQFDLVSSERVTGRRGINFRFKFTTIQKHLYYSSNQFELASYHSGEKATEKTYPSVTVTEAEYERFSGSAAFLEARRREQLGGRGYQSSRANNKASWLRAERSLYEQIDIGVRAEGYRLQSIKVTPGPDYSAGFANVGIRSKGFLQEFFRGRYCGGIYLKIDRLANDTWYAKQVPHPRFASKAVPDLEIEFLVGPGAKMDRSQRKALIKKGRELLLSPRPLVPTEWKTSLSNGAIIEFIGICENPSVDKQWWRPDGTLIDSAPYFSDDVHHPDSENMKMYELAWRIVLPELADAGTPEILVEGAVPPEGKQTRSIRDRYGNSIIKSFYGAVYGFEKTRKQTTLKLGVKLGADPYRRVAFQDISLVPGQNRGFKVVMEN